MMCICFFAYLVHSINIDPLSGVISVSENAVLDAEITESYIFTVEASDDSGAVNLTQVTLNCEDVNDNAPFFLRHLAELSIQEFTLDDMPADPIITFQVICMHGLSTHVNCHLTMIGLVVLPQMLQFKASENTLKDRYHQSERITPLQYAKKVN